MTTKEPKADEALAREIFVAAVAAQVAAGRAPTPYVDLAEDAFAAAKAYAKVQAANKVPFNVGGML
ncbi:MULTISPECIES: hypothetical protein [Stenotrophomonas]|jgi:hypothetical protein|uniref:Uncharacterized protein n=1 Tax=Stenotrophomonas maltophilia TaxID=40324 RepID=A0A4S2D308_STEMA|nr:hypothetical protein [Stenotrophomonas maltophilia]TGY35261.1 hypothetical protein E5352_05950 [Stenotrophomonas maltophilia]